MTKSLREAQIKEKMDRYPKVSTNDLHTLSVLFYLPRASFKCRDFCLQVVLRVQFPDRHVLQGFFRPLETGVCLRTCVRTQCGKRSFQLASRRYGCNVKATCGFPTTCMTVATAE